MTRKLHRRIEGVVHRISIVRRSQKLVDRQEGVTDSKVGQRGSKAISWPRFQKEFLQQKFPKILRDAKAREFMDVT
jgi:hypothetical protein